MKTKLFMLLSSAVLITFYSCDKNVKDQAAAPMDSSSDTSVMTAKEINSNIETEFSATGYFDWKHASVRMLWSALQQQSDRIMCIGFKPAFEGDIDNKISTLNIRTAEWQDAKQQVLNLIWQSEKKKNPSLRLADVEVWKEDKLPVVDVEVKNIETIRLLRASNLIRYVEPMGYDPIAYEDKAITNSSGSGIGGSGCGGYDGNTSLVQGVDYTTITPNTKISWNYTYHNITQAWTKSTGTGIKVMVIDTGVDPDQDNFTTGFNQGLSTGRTIQKLCTIPGETTVDDGCGHGTTMSGAVAAPRGTDGNSCGVAYNCNYVICRAAHDVYIDESSEVKGVSNAYTYAADDTSIRIVSMSLGRINSNGQIKDAINYAYGKGKLMFCAGGTSFSWDTWLVGVIFPANLPNVQAITGVQDKSTTTACADCHKGKEIDYVIVMERAKDGMHQISTAIAGDVPTTVGGSSVSTADASAIAALVWSRFPSYSREDVLNNLTTTASLYPKKNSNYGWGILNADAATN